jgi:ATP-dependent Lon protease
MSITRSMARSLTRYSSSSSSLSSDTSLSDTEEEEEDEEEEELKYLYRPDTPRRSTRKKTYLDTITEEMRTKILEEETMIEEINKCDVPIKYKILQKDHIDIREKARLLKLADNIPENSGESAKTLQYLNTIIDVPFGKYIDIGINSTKPNEVNTFLVQSKDVLDSIVYGHDSAKMEILQMISQMISNPQCRGQVLGIYGPAGIGKTTLIKDGLSKVLNRPFSFISLGGCSDACYLEGHHFTYEGSKPGNIVELLKHSQCMNPVIYFDELDKISDTSKGEEIVNLLIHMTDDSQNMKFTDKYLGQGLSVDLSRTIMVFSFNDLDKINPILKDRINMVSLNDFTIKDKIQIAKNYLLKGILQDYGVSPKTIVFSDEILEYLFTKYTNHTEDTGVRKFKFVLKTIVSKLNMIMLVKFNPSILTFLNIDTLKIPILLTEPLVDALLKFNNDKKDTMSEEILKTLYS